jgi:uncharacterized protein with ATP-grasp and redox domains
METGNDCLVCFLRQAPAMLRGSADDPQHYWQMTGTVGGLLAGFNRPPRLKTQSMLIARLTGVADPYLTEEGESNAFALALESRIRQPLEEENDSLLAAIQFLINANVLDGGAQYRLKREAVLASCGEPLVINHYPAQQRIPHKPTILYLADKFVNFFLINCWPNASSPEATI